MEKFYPVMWLGFWINVASGFAMLMADASTKMINPVFYVKLVFVAIAVLMMHRLRENVFRDQTAHGMIRVPLRSQVMAGALLMCWVGAIAAGRLMAYLGPVSGAPKLNNTF